MQKWQMFRVCFAEFLIYMVLNINVKTPLPNNSAAMHNTQPTDATC